MGTTAGNALSSSQPANPLPPYFHLSYLSACMPASFLTVSRWLLSNHDQARTASSGLLQKMQMSAVIIWDLKILSFFVERYQATKLLFGSTASMEEGNAINALHVPYNWSLFCGLVNTEKMNRVTPSRIKVGACLFFHGSFYFIFAVT